MLNTSPIAVLWDDSHIWGLMALRALRDLDFPVRLLKGSDIAQGALFRKQGSAAGPAVSLLVAPGGSARLKAEGLGPEGQQAVRDFVQAGGRYLGFCGGAGLALSHNKGLGLCPWGRASYPERILHLISGHVRATISPSPFTPRWDSPEASLPVWWAEPPGATRRETATLRQRRRRCGRPRAVQGAGYGFLDCRSASFQCPQPRLQGLACALRRQPVRGFSHVI